MRTSKRLIPHRFFIKKIVGWMAFISFRSSVPVYTIKEIETLPEIFVSIY